MKHHPIHGRHVAAFTLIELLVVIGIIALLASIAVPAGNMVLQKARALQAKTAMKGVEIAVNAYRTEYNRLPLAAGKTGEVSYILGPGAPEGDEDGLPLLAALMANDVDNNPRQIKFYDPQTAKSGTNGYSTTGAKIGLLDPWGQGYTMIINYDHETTPMVNPYAGESGETATELNSTVVLYSAGPDGAGGNTSKRDDIKSW